MSDPATAATAAIKSMQAPAAAAADEHAEGLNLGDRVRNVLRARKISQTQAAQEIGMAPSCLSAWLRQAYDGNVGEVERKVAIWLAAEEARAAEKLPAVPAWVKTETSVQIEAALSYAQLAGDIAVIYGGAGMGKTVAARHYADHNPAAWPVAMTAATGRTLGQALRHIARTLGLRQLPQVSADTEALLIHRLRSTRGLLMIDEAQHLCPGALETVRAIHDATGIGVALLGNELAYARLTGGDRSAAFAQLFSRIGKRLHLIAATAKDISALADAWGLDAPARRLAARLATEPGALRGLTKTLRFAAILGDLKAATIHQAAAALTEDGGAA